MSNQTDRLNTALAGPYRIERHLGQGEVHAKLAGKAPKLLRTALSIRAHNMYSERA
jgi:hypothetical protein